MKKGKLWGFPFVFNPALYRLSEEIMRWQGDVLTPFNSLTPYNSLKRLVFLPLLFVEEVRLSRLFELANIGLPATADVGS